MLNRNSSIAAGLLVLGTVCAGTAQAADVHWSVGINLPPVGTVISSGPVYYPSAPVIYAPPPPVVVQPAPVVVYRPAPPPMVVYRPAPPPVIVHPAPVYAPRYYGPGVIRTGWAVPVVRGGWHDGRPGYEHRHDRRDDWRDERRDERRHHH
ncbi:MAG TPA: hypothetical protein VFL86_12265 [Burkholderiaceae bacterium]|nr:hypothetical protein [Burkholderiaceae bacterium]